MSQINSKTTLKSSCFVGNSVRQRYFTGLKSSKAQLRYSLREGAITGVSFGAMIHPWKIAAPNAFGEKILSN